MKRLMSRSGVQRVVGDQCQYGLKSKDDLGEGPARKRIGFLTNSVCIARRLENDVRINPSIRFTDMWY